MCVEYTPTCTKDKKLFPLQKSFYTSALAVFSFLRKFIWLYIKFTPESILFVPRFLQYI